MKTKTKTDIFNPEKHGYKKDEGSSNGKVDVWRKPGRFLYHHGETWELSVPPFYNTSFLVTITNEQAEQILGQWI